MWRSPTRHVTWPRRWWLSTTERQRFWWAADTMAPPSTSGQWAASLLSCWDAESSSRLRAPYSRWDVTGSTYLSSLHLSIIHSSLHPSSLHLTEQEADSLVLVSFLYYDSPDSCFYLHLRTLSNQTKTSHSSVYIVTRTTGHTNIRIRTSVLWKAVIHSSRSEVNAVKLDVLTVRSKETDPSGW